MNKKKMIVAGCAGAALGLLAQGTVSLAGNVAEPAPAVASLALDTVKVSGRGVGTDRAAALKDAYRDAIERAVGLYVDAEQMAKNDQIVSDQILTQSNAYIEQYDMVKESTADGLVTVKIIATVRKSKLTKKLSDVMPPQSFTLGNETQNLHARIVTKEKRGADAAALLEHVLKGLDPLKQLMLRMTLADTKPIIKEPESSSSNQSAARTIACYYRFKFELDEQKYYDDFLPPLLEVLDQIALEKKTVRFQAAERNCWESSGSASESAKYIAGERNIDGKGVWQDVVELGWVKGSWLASRRGFINTWNENGFIESSSNNSHIKEKKFFDVVVITKLNKNRRAATAIKYRLPPDCWPSIVNWQTGICGVYSDYKTTGYNIILKDKEGDEVAVRNVAYENGIFINARAGHVYDLFEGSGTGWYVTPMMHTDARCAQSWIKFDVPRDDLTRIASISIELAE